TPCRAPFSWRAPSARTFDVSESVPTLQSAVVLQAPTPLLHVPLEQLGTIGTRLCCALVRPCATPPSMRKPAARTVRLSIDPPPRGRPAPAQFGSLRARRRAEHCQCRKIGNSTARGAPAARKPSHWPAVRPEFPLPPASWHMTALVSGGQRENSPRLHDDGGDRGHGRRLVHRSAHPRLVQRAGVDLAGEAGRDALQPSRAHSLYVVPPHARAADRRGNRRLPLHVPRHLPRPATGGRAADTRRLRGSG